MRAVTSRLTSLLGGSVVGTPFAIAAASHGTIGLAVGAAVVLLSALLSADGLFWPLALLTINRHQRWAWRKTGSIEHTLLLDAPARHTLEVALHARARLDPDNTAPLPRHPPSTPRRAPSLTERDASPGSVSRPE